MSFYYDDDEQSDVDNEESFQCITCGSTDYYIESGGALCCSSCFTQSQQLTQESTELDVDEVQALAARTSTGRVLNRTPKKTGGAAASNQERKPLHEYDKSTPFPNLITCIHGIQEVMKYCIEPLCILVGLEDEMDQVKRTVQKLWMAYMRAWTDGAEFYGRLHPEIRFSFRDYFLPVLYKTKVIKHLSHQAALAVRAELDINEEEKKDDSMIEADAATSGPTVGSEESNDEEGDGEEPEDLSLPKRHQETIQHFAPTYHNPKSLMWMYWHYGKRGRLEAALITPPSMKLVACLLWLAISRAGVTLNHVLQWMANGAIPLQNAFAHCLTEQERKALIHVAAFFRISKLPALNEMENTVNKLVVACGLKSFSHLHGLPPTTARNPQTIASTDTMTATNPTTDEIKDRPDFSYVTPRSVPLLTARLIDDLGFGKEVLYRSLALMGILNDPPQDLWLPAPLVGALPKNLATTAQVLAVIAVACRMTPGWETWVYPGPFGRDETMINGRAEKASKRQRAEAESIRFVPCNEDNFQLLRNGTLVEGYLDYLEDIVLDEEEAIFPRFRSTLGPPNQEATVANSTETRKTETVVQKPQAMKVSRNPLRPERIWRRQKLHDWKLNVKRKRARWADANGLGEYLIYEDPLSHAEDRKRTGIRRNPTPEPFHPQYGLLIEYISYKTNVKSSKIHAAITVLDDEVLRIMRPPENTTKRRKSTRSEPATSVGEVSSLTMMRTDEVSSQAVDEPSASAGCEENQTDVCIVTV